MQWHAGFKISQSFLGAPKIHRPKDPGADLGPMFFQVVNTIFQLSIDFEYLWKDSFDSQPTSVFGFGLGVREDPPVVNVNTANLLNNFKEGIREFGEVWKKVIAPINLEDIMKLEDVPVDDISVDAGLWARILFDYMVAYRDELVDRAQLIKSLIPVYFIRTLGFVNCTKDMDTRDAEDFLDNECCVMEAEKYYLISKWNQTPRKDGIPSITQYLSD